MAYISPELARRGYTGVTGTTPYQSSTTRQVTVQTAIGRPPSDPKKYSVPESPHSLAAQATTKFPGRPTVPYRDPINGGISITTLSIDDKTAQKDNEWRKAA